MFHHAQGEAGAYSEKSLRELLGSQVVAVGQESFEDAFKAVRVRERETQETTPPSAALKYYVLH